MKFDYNELYDSVEVKDLFCTRNGFTSEVQYFEIYRTAGMSDSNSDIKQISMAIQKSKYDGSDNSFDEWVFRPKKE